MKDELLEKLAEKVHDSWWEEKTKQGFHHPEACIYLLRHPRPVIAGKCPKCHHDMKPYSKLSKEVKELDRVMIRGFEKHLEELDCYIVNRKEWKKDDPRGRRY